MSVRQTTRRLAMSSMHTHMLRSTKWTCRGPRVIAIKFHLTAEHMVEDAAPKELSYADQVL